MPLQLGAMQKAKYDVEDLQKIFATQNDVKAIADKVESADQAKKA